MNIFQEVGLTWDGEEYVVKAENVMGLIETIESVITLEELSSQRGIQRAKVSKAFAMALRYAGCKGVTQQHVYTAFFNSEKSIEIQNVITTLLMMMIPPEHLQEKTPPAKTVAPRKSSKKKDS